MTIFQKIRIWANRRELLKADPFKQFVKLNEEIGELANAIIKNKKEEEIDAFGDIVVVLVVLAKQRGLSLEKCVEKAYEVIKNREGKMKDGIFIKKEDL